MRDAARAYHIFATLCLLFAWWWWLCGTIIPPDHHAAFDPFAVSAISLVCFGVVFETWDKIQKTRSAKQPFEKDELEIVATGGAWLLMGGLISELAIIPLLQNIGHTILVPILALLIPIYATITCGNVWKNLAAKHRRNLKRFR
ncbi:MAG: hypothetical protein P4N59_30955 [Negativicutes bacterium]|nr:hypothetical protein [Negativicutes bacterium]